MSQLCAQKISCCRTRSWTLLLSTINLLRNEATLMASIKTENKREEFNGNDFAVFSLVRLEDPLILADDLTSQTSNASSINTERTYLTFSTPRF